MFCLAASFVGSACRNVCSKTSSYPRIDRHYFNDIIALLTFDKRECLLFKSRRPINNKQANKVKKKKKLTLKQNTKKSTFSFFDKLALSILRFYLFTMICVGFFVHLLRVLFILYSADCFINRIFAKTCRFIVLDRRMKGW